jgi:hypothetical protein
VPPDPPVALELPASPPPPVEPLELAPAPLADFDACIELDA